MLTLLLLVPIAAEHKALLLQRYRVVEALDAGSRAAALDSRRSTAADSRFRAALRRSVATAVPPRGNTAMFLGWKTIGAGPAGRQRHIGPGCNAEALS